LKSEFLFRVRPDLFPVAMLTPLESELWSLFFDEQKAHKPKH
jgi:hypothetical protein